MNFLLRSTNSTSSNLALISEDKATPYSSSPAKTLEGLIAEDPFPSLGDDAGKDNQEGDSSAFTPGLIPTDQASIRGHIDVSEDDGWIIIPCKELPANWSDVPDLQFFHALDRQFVFPGEQIHILAFLSVPKQDEQIKTPSIDVEVKKDNGVLGSGERQKNAETNSNGDLQEAQTEDDQRTRVMLEKFRNSHYFVRIVESSDSLQSNGKENKKRREGRSSSSAFIDRGNFDGSVAGGMARNSVTCCVLHNRYIVVLLEVNVGVDQIKDPVLEILQFDKFQSSTASKNQDPYGELLTWLIPVDRALPAPSRSLSPSLSSAISQKPGSQLFSFGNLRSQSMPAIPQPPLPSSPVHPPPPSRNPNSGLEGPDRSSSDGVLSFRGVPLEPERFSSACGLEGIHIPAWRWRKRLEIIQPVEIHSFAAECNTEDLVCVQIKNVSPAHLAGLVIIIDAITLVFEEAPKDGPPLCLPISCIEAGNEFSLPNVSLRNGEEHSFILKPANSPATSRESPSAGQFAVLVSCRCNFTESKLFFKKPTSWRPRFSRDLMVSVTSEISAQTFGSGGGSSQLPVQEMTLQASNLSNEDLTLTVLAPASFTSPPSVMSLNSPTSPLTPLAAAGFDFVPNSADLRCSHLWLQSTVPLGCVPARSSATVKLELLPLTDGIISLDTLQISVKEKGSTYMPEHPLKIHATSSIATGIS